MARRKYKIFISSSFEDLKDARRRLFTETLRIGHIPSGMELFHPTETQSLEVIEQEISSSDIFVILIGARLGTEISDNDNLTFTMQEFELAKKYKLPIIAYLLDGSEFSDARDAIPADRHNERMQEEPLRDFREQVQIREKGGKRIVGFFSHDNVDALAGNFANSINNCIESHFKDGQKGGWVHGAIYDELESRIVLEPSVSDNPFFERFARRLNKFSLLSQRTSIEKELKHSVATFFWQQYMAKLEEKNIRSLYFESGSSIAYVSMAFIEYFGQELWMQQSKWAKKLQIRTNNFLTYLDFFLLEPKWDSIWPTRNIQLQPFGAFSNDYGATYGFLKSAKKLPHPKEEILRTDLPADAKKLVERMTKELERDFSTSGLVLMTTSGVDVNPGSSFPGPHVGTFYNMLLKRSLLSLSCPKVLFLDETKWGFDFLLNNCHPICDHGFTWDTLRTSTPLAIALAAKNSDIRDEKCATLEANGFQHLETGELKKGVKGVWPVLAANDLFWEYFR